ncbi:MAG TPA: S8 family serine peptidase [Mycobacteriales bacterium]|nr:S8 family serine peptidase [Mycobacteriales bacterium]
MGTQRAVLAGATAMALTATLATASSAPASDNAASAVVLPALASAVAAGAAPAVLTWDRDVASAAEVRAHLAAEGVRATVLDGLSIAFACAGGPRELTSLASAPGAVSVWGDERLEAAPVTTSAAAGGVAPMGTDGVGLDGSGVGLAVVDTGLDSTHDAFTGRTLSNVRVLVSHREILGYGDPPPCQDFYTAELEDSELSSGHGTHLAGVAAGNDAAAPGLAPAADLVGVGVSDSVVVDTDLRDANRLSMFSALAGLNYALITGLDSANPIKVVLAGWVGKGLHNPFHPVSLAVRDLHDFGMTVVLPVGNGGAADSDCSTVQTCRISPFAVGSFAVGVASTTADGAALSAFSSRGDPEPRTAEGFPVSYEPLLAAPGESVIGPRRLGTANVMTPPTSFHAGGGSPTADQTDLDHVAMTGTSVAAAQVAGAVVLMQQAARDATGCFLPAATVRRLLTDTARPLPGAARHQAGTGVLDVDAAVAAALLEEPVRRNDPWMCPRTHGGTS